VVATGIDQASTQRPAGSASESRLADLGQRLRVEKQRDAESARPSASAIVNASIESAAKAAIAAAVEDVTIRPLAPKPTLFIDPAATEPEAEHAAAFIPPQPERMPLRAPRMPRIDELPLPGQNEIRAKRGELSDDHHPEKRHRSLLQRLASVGLGRREETPKPPAPRTAPLGPVSSTDRLAGRPMARPAESRPEPVSEYAKRTPQGLDQHGRVNAVHNSVEQDHLDIPAFLRRQAN
jgi:cell division protein FtsZ